MTAHRNRLSSQTRDGLVAIALTILLIALVSFVVLETNAFELRPPRFA